MIDFFAQFAPRKTLACLLAALAASTLAAPAAAYITIPGVQKSAVKVVNVSNAAGLTAALKAAKGPTEILLAPGNYGDVIINLIDNPFDIVIRSANNSNRATFSRLMMWKSSRVRLEKINFVLLLRPGETTNATGVMIRDSDHISFSRCNFLGNMNGTANDDGIAFRTLDSHHLLLFNNYFSEARIAIGMVNTTRSSLFANRIRDVREGVNFNGVETVRVERNYVSHVIPNVAEGDHADAFQIFYGTNADARITKDVLFQSNAIILDRGNAQALHVRNARTSVQHQKIRAFHNVIFTGVRQGLWIEDTGAITLERNTIVRSPQWVYDPAIFLRNARVITVRRNIFPVFSMAEGVTATQSDNIDLADAANPAGPTAASQLAGNINVNDPPLAAFAAKNGSQAKQQFIGAQLSPGVGGFSGTDAVIEKEFQTVLKQVRSL